MNGQPERVADTSAEAWPPQTIPPSDKREGAWAEGATLPDMTHTNTYAQWSTPTPGHHLQAQALLPYARRIVAELGHQRHRLQGELTPTLNELGILAEAMPPDTIGRQQAEFIIATIHNMMHDATEAEQRAQQVVSQVHPAKARGLVPKRLT